MQQLPVIWSVSGTTTRIKICSIFVTEEDKLGMRRKVIFALRGCRGDTALLHGGSATFVAN
jgi:hypothetical protein